MNEISGTQTVQGLENTVVTTKRGYFFFDTICPYAIWYSIIYYAPPNTQNSLMNIKIKVKNPFNLKNIANFCKYHIYILLLISQKAFYSYEI